MSSQNTESGTTRRRLQPTLWQVTLEAGAIHALVDGACGALLYAEVAAGRMPPEALLACILWYNVLAFGMQILLGLVADLRRAYRLTSSAGPWLVAAGVLTATGSPWTGAMLAGIGNACFHVGTAGALLPRCDDRARHLGVFIGPGAIGLALGVWLGSNTVHWREPGFVLLVAAGIRLARLLNGPNTLSVPRGKPKVSVGPCLVVAALLVSVSIRGAVGGLLSAAWRSSVVAGFGLAAAACIGKCLGGFVVDGYGWRGPSVAALLVAAPLMVVGLHCLPLALTGMLLVQSTMAVTLAGVYRASPAWPGLAFGLPSLALLLGSLPGFTPWSARYQELAQLLAVPAVLLSAVLLYLGLPTRREAAEAMENKAPVKEPDLFRQPPFGAGKPLAPGRIQTSGTLLRDI